jgi:uncharacterized ion transporter superfamily protein YfcC
MRVKIPNTYFLISILIVLTAILTWIIPAGVFIDTPTGKEFQWVEASPQGFAAILTAPIRGFVEGAQIIAFVLIVGGAFGVFRKTDALTAAIHMLVRWHSQKAWMQRLILPLMIGIFSLAGAVFGMSEEVIPFILVFIPLTIALGYDTITAVAVTYVAAHTGFAAAFLNPFTIGIAQGIAEVPLFSGLPYRLAAWLVFTLIAIFFINRHARRVMRDPTCSPTFREDEERRREGSTLTGKQKLDLRHQLVLACFTAAMLVLVFGVLIWQWYINEIAALFLVMGIIVGIAGRLSIQATTAAFLEGAKELLGTALIIALARAVLLLANEGQIIDTILYTLADSIDHWHPIVASQAMFLIQTLINFFVPSGSGQAALTMPIMAPLGDLIGVSRQTVVLAFQFGDGISNMIIPTSPVLMGVLALAKIPYGTWFKWMIGLELLFIATAMLLLIPPFFMAW